MLDPVPFIRRSGEIAVIDEQVAGAKAKVVLEEHRIFIDLRATGAQATVKAVIDGLPLSSIDGAIERIDHGDVASRTALSGLGLGLMRSASIRPNRNGLSSFRASSRLSPIDYDQL